MIICGPAVCDLPKPAGFDAGDSWTCPKCGTRYRLSKPKPERFWRTWSAVDGHWRVESPLRGWWERHTARRDAVDAQTEIWLRFISTPEDQAQGITDAVTKLPGQRLGRHRATQPGDIPDQPAGGAG